MKSLIIANLKSKIRFNTKMFLFITIFSVCWLAYMGLVNSMEALSSYARTLFLMFSVSLCFQDAGALMVMTMSFPNTRKAVFYASQIFKGILSVCVVLLTMLSNFILSGTPLPGGINEVAMTICIAFMVTSLGEMMGYILYKMGRIGLFIFVIAFCALFGAAIGSLSAISPSAGDFFLNASNQFAWVNLIFIASGIIFSVTSLFFSKKYVLR